MYSLFLCHELSLTMLTNYRVEYFDEASRDLGTSVDDKTPSEPSVFSIKNVHINGGVTLHTDIFVPCHRDSATPTLPDDFAMTSTMSSDIFVSS